MIVIDVQNDYCAPDGVVGRQATQSGNVIVGRIAGLLEQARSAGVLVVMTQMVADESDRAVAWRARRPHAPTDRPVACREGEWGADIYRLRPDPGDVHVVKRRYSAFTGTQLGQELRRRGRDSLLFCGFATDVCVETTVRDAVCRDFYATLVEDCCGAVSARRHERAVEAVRSDFGWVTDSGEVLRHWRDRRTR